MRKIQHLKNRTESHRWEIEYGNAFFNRPTHHSEKYVLILVN